MKANIDNQISQLGKPKAAPDYDKEVLEPLHRAQEAEADRVAAEQAEAERQRQLEVISVVRAPQVSGNCGTWLAQAGVTDVADAMWIITRESGCNPRAVNPNGGACGIAQELPCGKSGCVFGDAVCQIRWMQAYVNERYGGWAGAVAFWRQNNWY